MSNQQARLESIEAQLSMVEKTLKASELEAAQKGHKASSLDKTCQQLQEKTYRLEEYSSGLEKRSKDAEAKLAQVTDKANTLEVEKERLLQQVEHTHTYYRDTCPAAGRAHTLIIEILVLQQVEHTHLL